MVLAVLKSRYVNVIASITKLSEQTGNDWRTGPLN